MTVTGSLKFDISVTPQLAAKAVTLRRQWAPHRPVWIATSTHEGEESVVIAAHQALLQQFPNLLLILVPRHPERFPDAINLVRQAGLSYITRSSGKSLHQHAGCGWRYDGRVDVTVRHCRSRLCWRFTG